MQAESGGKEKDGGKEQEHESQTRVKSFQRLQKVY